MKILPPILTLTLAMFLFGCSDLINGKGEAEKAISEFHTLFDQEKYSEIYSQADPEFKKVTTQDKLDEFLGAVHRKLGKVKSTSNKDWNLGNWNGKSRVKMLQETAFETGKGNESFTFALRGGKAILLGYNISSTDLILK